MIPKLTVEQADELAERRLALRKSVGAFLRVNWDSLPTGRRDELDTLSNQLGDEVDHLTAVAIKLTVADLQETLTNLGKATDSVNHAIAHVNDIKKVLTVATALVGLSTALVSVDPAGTIAALQGIVSSLHS